MALASGNADPGQSVPFGGDQQDGADAGGEAGSLTDALLKDLQAEPLRVLTPNEYGELEQLVAEVGAMIRSSCERIGAGTHLPAAPPSGEEVGALLPLGSYQYNILTVNDDVDLVFIAPTQLQLPDLAKTLAEDLGRCQAKCICTAEPDGRLAAPGLRFIFRNRAFKLLLAQQIPGLPAPSAEAGVVNNAAALVAREACTNILERVPNVERFQTLLRFVKHWAKSRGIYGTLLGFVSGTAWAIACARVCQLQPQHEIAELVCRFFRQIARWDWSRPVAVEDPAAPELLFAGAQAGELAPRPFSFLLPVGQGLSAMPQLSNTTCRIVGKELRRAEKMIRTVENSSAGWMDVCSASKFFQRHRHYLSFEFMASSEEVLSAWTSWSQEQLQHMVQFFEGVPSTLVSLRPWPLWMDFKDPTWPHSRAVIVGLHLESSAEDQPGVRRTFDLREPIVRFLEHISLWPEAQKYPQQFDLLIRHVQQSELQAWLDERQNDKVVTRPQPTALPGASLEGMVGETTKL